MHIDAPRTITVGRGSECQLRIAGDSEASRFHCRLEVNPPYCRVTDVGSRNGTFLNEDRILEAPARHGDVVRCGRSRILIRVSGTSDVEEYQTVIGPAVTDNLPSSLGGYQVIREIGRGAMGRVLLARQPGTGREAAIKVVIPEFAAEGSRLALFIREASVLSRLKHPRIVEVLDFGIQDQWPYLVLEYLPVLPLEDLLNKAPLENRIRIACRVTSLVLEGLQFAHSQGFVHRDVKPSNLLAYYSGPENKLHIKLADFGLAKSFETAGLSGMTGSRETRGTIVFMPPEQLLDSRSVGPASDIYSTGAALYRMLSGSAPYEARSLSEALSAVLNHDPQPLRERVASVPEELAAVVDKAMAREPGRRYSSAEEMRTALLPFGRRR